MVRAILRKDPDETRIEPMDWTLGLNDGATIVSSSWSFPAGITKVSDGIVVGGLKSYVKMSGGTAGEDYILTNTIVTSDGETLEQSGKVQVRHSTST